MAHNRNAHMHAQGWNELWRIITDSAATALSAAHNPATDVGGWGAGIVGVPVLLARSTFGADVDGGMESLLTLAWRLSLPDEREELVRPDGCLPAACPPSPTLFPPAAAAAAAVPFFFLSLWLRTPMPMFDGTLKPNHASSWRTFTIKSNASRSITCATAAVVVSSCGL